MTNSAAMTMHDITNRLQELGVDVPGPAGVKGNYVPVARFNNMLHISGQIAKHPDGTLFTGRLGENLDIEAGQKAAQSCAVQIIGAALGAMGDDDAVVRIIKLNGFVNSTPDFDQQPAIINGASDFMAEVFGEIGAHARAAVGMAALPFNVAVEIDALIGLK